MSVDLIALENYLRGILAGKLWVWILLPCKAAFTHIGMKLDLVVNEDFHHSTEKAFKI